MSSYCTPLLSLLSPPVSVTQMMFSSTSSSPQSSITTSSLSLYWMVYHYSLYQWQSKPVLPIDTDRDNNLCSMYTFNACWRDSNFWWFYGSKRMLWFLLTGKVLIFHCLISVSPPPLSLSLHSFSSFLSLSSFYSFFPPSSSSLPLSLSPSLSLFLPPFLPSLSMSSSRRWRGGVPLQWGLEVPLLAAGLVATPTASHGVARAMVLGEVRTYNWIID